MNSAEKREAGISKVKIVKTNYVSYMAGAGDAAGKAAEKISAKVGETLAKKGAEKGTEAVAKAAGDAAAKAGADAAKGGIEEAATATMMGGGGGAPAAPQQPPVDPKKEAKIAEQWANAQTAVEAKKLSLREHNPKVVEIIFLVLLAVAFYFGASTDSTILRSVLLVVLAFLFVTKQFLFEYLRERIHIPEHINAGVILNIAIATLIIWSGAPLEWAIVFMIITIVLSQYGPWMWGKLKEWNKKRKKAKDEGVEEEKASLEERAKSISNRSVLIDFIDFGLGWVPIAGDIMGFFINMILPIRCIFHRLIGIGAFFKMIIINVIDVFIGVVPVIGDIADFICFSNVINSKILKKEVDRRKRGLEEKGSGIWLLLLIFIILFGGFFAAAPFLSNFGGWVGSIGSAGNRAIESVRYVIQEFHPIDSARGWYKRQLAIATGDYYTGKVDENAKAKLGVYLEDLKQADPIFYTDRNLIMYATLKVQTLDNPINVTLSCTTSGLDKDATPPQLFPKSSFEVDVYEEQEIDCLFAKDSVSKGAWTFEIGAEFDFKTLSYIKSYFMESERLRSMRREEIDPLGQYGIKDKKPSAIYTNGPVEIGMGMGNPPVGLDLGQPQSAMTLGITISNRWNGDITKMNRFVLIVPKGFNLQEIGAPYKEVGCDQLPAEERPLCNKDLNTVYEINDSSFVEIKKGQFKSYRAYLRINRGDYEKILGLTPVATKYFKVTADYTYRLKKSKLIEVKTRQRASLAGVVAGGGADMTPPTVSNVNSVITTPGTVKITWTTNEKSNDIFSYVSVPAGTGGPTPNEEGFETSHERIIENLPTGKTYQYTITSTDTSGNPGQKQGTFKS